MAQQIKNIIQLLMAQKNSIQFSLIERWPTIVGNLAQYLFIEKIEKDTLILGVTNASWLQEMYLLSPHILEKINQNLDSFTIKQIKFKQIEKRKKVIKPMMVEKKEWKTVTLSQKEQAAIDRLEDKDLAESLKKFLMRCYQEK